MARKQYTDLKFENLTKLFDSIEPKPNQHVVFMDYIDLVIGRYSSNYKMDVTLVKQRYNQKEWFTLGQMFVESLDIIQKELKTNDCFDLFGTFVLSHKELNKYFNRFFTIPPEVSKLAAGAMNYQNSKTFYDPHCGTARISLEVNSKKTGLFHTLINQDLSCAKISALNLMMHGIDGMVICDNALNPRSNFKGAFIVNRLLHIEKYPRIDFVKKTEEAYQYMDARVMEKKIQAKFTELKNEEKNGKSKKLGENQKGI